MVPDKLERNLVFLGIGLGAFATTALFSLGLFVANLGDEEPVSTKHLIPKDIITAYNTGIKDALRTNPPSMELEMKCLELWANKQPNQPPLK